MHIRLIYLSLLLFPLLGSQSVWAQAQPTSSFPVRKACRELVPQVLYILGADQVTANGNLYVFQKHLDGADSLRISADSMPNVFLVQNRFWTLKYDLKAGRVLLINRMSNGITHLNSSTYLFHKFELDHLRDPTSERFLLEAVSVAFLYQTNTTESRQGERMPGSLMAVAFVFLPRLSAESFRLTQEFDKAFCPSDDEVYEGAAAEVIPFGGINICFRKGRR